MIRILKSRFILLTLIFLCSLPAARSQFIQGALILGGNVSQVDGDEIYGFNKLGFNAGAAAIVPFTDSWSLSIEALYSQKGAHRGPLYPNEEVDGAYDYRLNYAEIPVLIMFTDKDVITFGAGFSFNRLVSYTEDDNRIDELNTVEYSGPPATNSFEVLGDMRFRVYKNLKMNFRYSYSIAPYREVDFYYEYLDHPEHRKQYNSVMTWRLIYVINEKQSRQTRKENEIINDMQ